MRVLLEDSDGDVSKFIGIALGVAGGVIVLTGLLWFLYRRYGDLGGSLTGIPPERKMLVFTDLGKLPDIAQRSHMRLNSARMPSRGVLPAAAALAAAVAAAPPPTPGSAASPRAVGGGASRPASGGRAGGSAASGSLLPALSVGLEAEPLPSTPGSIASPRGHGRALFNTMDHPRSSNAGGPGLAAADDSRPGSASTQPRGGSRGGTADGGLAAAVGGGGERPGSGATGPRPSSSGSTAQARGRSCLAAAAAAAAAPGTALPPALVPTGSVTTAWKVPPAPSELSPERSLNSLAAETTTSPVEAFDAAAPPGGAAAAAAGPRVVSISGYVGVTAIAAGTGRPPLPYRSSASGSMPAAVAAAAAGSLGTAAAAASSGGGVASPVRSRISRSRPGDGGDGPRSGGGADGGGGGGGGGGATGSPLPGPSWQRPNGMRTSRPSQVAGRLSGTGVPDDTMSTISGASSQFHSFSHAGEDAGFPQHPPQSHSQQQQQQQQLEPQPAGGSGAASVLPGTASPLQRSRLAAATIPGIDQNSSAGGSQAPASEALAAAPTPAASVALTVAAELTTESTLLPARSGKAAAAAAALEISEVVDSVGSRAVSSPGAAGRGGGGGGGAAGSSNGALEVQSTSIGSGGGGETSLQHTSPTQAAWAAAVSLSSKLFGRGSRAGTPATQAQ